MDEPKAQKNTQQGAPASGQHDDGIFEADEDFVAYSRKILLSIKEGLDRGELDEVQTAALLIRLSNAATKQELYTKIRELQQKYPALGEVLFQEKKEVKEGLDEAVHRYASFLIKKGKALEAAEIAGALSEGSATLEALREQHPDFAAFLDNNPLP